MAEFKYEINHKLATLSENGDYETQVNVITYGDYGHPKLDIRKWNVAENKMAKGITLTKGEALNLLKVLQEFEFDEID